MEAVILILQYILVVSNSCLRHKPIYCNDKVVVTQYNKTIQCNAIDTFPLFSSKSHLQIEGVWWVVGCLILKRSRIFKSALSQDLGIISGSLKNKISSLSLFNSSLTSSMLNVPLVDFKCYSLNFLSELSPFN